MLLVLCLLSFLVVFEIFRLWFFCLVFALFCLVAVLVKIRSMLVYFYFVFRLWSCSFVFVWLVEVWLNLSGCGLVSSVLSGAFGLK